MPVERRQPVRKTVAKTTAPTTRKKTKKDTERWRVVTPSGVAGFCYLVEPDEYLGKEFYKAPIKFPKATTDKHAEEIDTFVGKVFDLYEKVEDKHKAIHNCPLQDGDELGHDSLKGYWVLNTKSKDPIPVYDTKKREINPSKIWGGDLIRVGLDFVEMAKPGFKPSLSAYALYVQLLEKRSMSGREELLNSMSDWEGEGYEEEEDSESDADLDDDIPF